MTEKLLSIVVPMYNVENYVVKGLESTISQGLDPESYEIIVIDDLSTDSSLERARSVAADHPDITVVASDKAGIGETRNKGMRMATGRYLMFLDPDDWFEPDVFRTIVEIMDQQNLDMLNFSYRPVEELPTGEEWCKVWEQSTGERIITGPEYIAGNEVPSMVWSYAYRRSFLVNNDLWMQPHMHEDECFTFCALAMCKRIRHLSLIVYNYLRRNGSFMQAYNPRHTLDLLKAESNMINYALRRGLPVDSLAMRMLQQRKDALIWSAVRNAVRKGYGIESEMADDLKELRLLPIANPGHSLRKWIFNRWPRFYLHGMKLVYRIKRK